MTVANYIFIILGVIIAMIGALSIIFPGLTRIINAPGDPRLKSIIAIIVGVIILIIGITVEMSST